MGLNNTSISTALASLGEGFGTDTGCAGCALDGWKEQVCFRHTAYTGTMSSIGCTYHRVKTITFMARTHTHAVDYVLGTHYLELD